MCRHLRRRALHVARWRRPSIGKRITTSWGLPGPGLAGPGVGDDPRLERGLRLLREQVVKEVPPRQVGDDPRLERGLRLLRATTACPLSTAGWRRPSIGKRITTSRRRLPRAGMLLLLVGDDPRLERGLRRPGAGPGGASSWGCWRRPSIGKRITTWEDSDGIRSQVPALLETTLDWKEDYDNIPDVDVSRPVGWRRPSIGKRITTCRKESYLPRCSISLETTLDWKEDYDTSRGGWRRRFSGLETTLDWKEDEATPGAGPWTMNPSVLGRTLD